MKSSLLNKSNRIMLRVIPFVLGIILAKLIVQSLGWELLVLNSIFTTVLLLLIQDLDDPFGYSDDSSSEDLKTRCASWS